MDTVIRLFERIDAFVATENPFTAGSIAGALAALIAGLFAAFALRRALTIPELLDEAKRDEALTKILRTSHANPPMSRPAKKGLGLTKDDRTVEELRRRHLANLVQMSDRRRG